VARSFKSGRSIGRVYGVIVRYLGVEADQEHCQTVDFVLGKRSKDGSLRTAELRISELCRLLQWNVDQRCCVRDEMRLCDRARGVDCRCRRRQLLRLAVSTTQGKTQVLNRNKERRSKRCERLETRCKVEKVELDGRLSRGLTIDRLFQGIEEELRLISISSFKSRNAT